VADEKKLIILRVKRKDPVFQHSSSWKVAYADFVTALMAFFLLMWLLAMIAPARRAEMAKYFREFTPVGKSTKAQIQEVSSVSKTPPQAQADQPAPSEKLRSDLSEIVKARLSDLRDQVLVDTFDAGVRVQVVDKQGRPMFDLGSPKLTVDAQKALKVIAESVQGMENKVAVEGHTDALSYSSNKYTNWELSTERASAARQELERNGLNPDRLVKVAGYAAVDPLIKANPYAPQNRRISILIYDKKDLSILADEKASRSAPFEKSQSNSGEKPEQKQSPVEGKEGRDH